MNVKMRMVSGKEYKFSIEYDNIETWVRDNFLGEKKPIWWMIDNKRLLFRVENIESFEWEE